MSIVAIARDLAVKAVVNRIVRKTTRADDDPDGGLDYPLIAAGPNHR